MKDLSRRNLILKLIIEQFVKTALPVGSKNLIKIYNLPYSSATIRSEMYELEKNKLLEKTHTSSGRVPSASGYQFYIDNLVEKEISKGVKDQIKIVLKDQNSLVNDVLERSCQILSEMTSLASMMMGPDRLNEKLSRIQLIPIDQKQGVCVLVTSSGHIEHKSFELEQKVDISDIEKCVEILNERLKETPLYDVVEKMVLLRPLLEKYIGQYEILIKAFVEIFKNMNKESKSYYGASNLLDKPEYYENMDKLKKMVKMIEGESVWKFINPKTSKGKIHVQIGVNDELEDISVISADVNYKGKEGTKIALVGPRRMDYSKVIATLEYLVNQLEKNKKEE